MCRSGQVYSTQDLFEARVAAQRIIKRIDIDVGSPKCLLVPVQFLESPAFAVPGGCRDTTGAGDAFHAGFIYGMLAGEDLETCLKLSNAVAALKCRDLGARTALPSRAELRQNLTAR